MLLEISGTEDFPRKKSRSWRKNCWLSTTTWSPYWGDHPISHHLGGTVQALKFVEKPAAVFWGMFRVRPKGCGRKLYWTDVNGRCSLDINSQEITSKRLNLNLARRLELKFDQFLPPKQKPFEFSIISFRFVVTSLKKSPPSPTSKTYQGWSPSDQEPEVDAFSKADQHGWCESGFFSAHPHWGKGLDGHRGQTADEWRFQRCVFVFFTKVLGGWYVKY